MEYNGTPDNERRIGELEGGKDLGKRELVPTPSRLGEEWLNFCNTTFEEAYRDKWGSIIPQDARSPTA